MRVLWNFLLVATLFFGAALGASKGDVQDSSVESVSIKRVLRSVSNKLNDAPCTDGTYKAEMNCLNYKVCIGDTWVTQSCPAGQLFSNGGCKWQWEASCDQGSCITGEKSQYQPDCTKYYYCNDDNQEVLMSCSEGFLRRHFDPSSGSCKLVLWWAKCPSTTEVCSNGQTSAGATSGEFRLCSGGVWSTVRCSGSNVYKAELNGCGCPKEAEHMPAMNPKQYLECQQGRWIQLDCLQGGVFNPSTKMCEKSRSKRSVTNLNDCVSGDTKSDVMSGVCSTYMFCPLDGKWTRRSCPKGEFYTSAKNSCSKSLCPYSPVPGNCESFVMPNGEIGTCEFGFRFDSVTRECVPFAEAKCLDVECEGRERKNHPTSCNKYLQCEHQQWKVEECGWFRNKFDMKTKECVFSWWRWGAKPSCRFDPVSCVEGSASPVGTDCRHYVTCTNQSEQEQTCLWPMKFDVTTRKCVWWRAKCE